MYLYAEHQDGRKLGGLRIKAMSYETTRALLEKHFPAARVLSPLEPWGIPTQAGKYSYAGSTFAVVTVYGSRTADGRARCTGMEQWGIETPAAAPKPGTQLIDWDRLGPADLKFMCEHVRRWTFKHLIETTNISRPEAFAIAEAAALQYAREIERASASSPEAEAKKNG